MQLGGSEFLTVVAFACFGVAGRPLCCLPLSLFCLPLFLSLAVCLLIEFALLITSHVLREDTYTAADCQAVQALVNFVVAQTNDGEPSLTVTSSAVDRITGAIVPLLRQLVLLQAVHTDTIVSTLTDSYSDLVASLSLPSLSSLTSLMTEASVGPGNLWHSATTAWLAASSKRTSARLLWPKLWLTCVLQALDLWTSSILVSAQSLCRCQPSTMICLPSSSRQCAQRSRTQPSILLSACSVEWCAAFVPLAVPRGCRWTKVRSCEWVGRGCMHKRKPDIGMKSC
jgi:hypothetical protein